MTLRNKSLSRAQRRGGQTALTPADPLLEISRLQRGIESVFDDFWSPVQDFRTFGPELAFNPLCDIEEADDHFLLTFDIPGVSKDDVKIEMRDNRLVVSGERKEESEKKEGNTVFSEREYGSFQRSFTLPSNVDADRIEAKFQDGVLYLALPKSATAKPKTIEIKEGKGGFFNKLLGGDKKKEPQKAA